jgi:DNA-binding LacI/PurR family transcriptional regulator
MQAVAWLVSLGHRRIAMASGTLAASDRARERYRGFQAGMAQAGLPPGELIEMPFMQTAVDRVSARLSRADRPTALLCSNDLLAIRCIRAARLAGLTVPDELSVIGIDGIALGDDLTPRLSTLAQPNRLIGETCVATLVDALRSGRLPKPADSSILPFRLSEGETCSVVSASQSASRKDTSNNARSKNAASPLPITTPRTRRKSMPRRRAALKSNPPDPRMLP